VEAYKEGAVFTAFDLETTGLDPEKDCIVEIGAVKFDRRGPICRYNVLVNPEIPMPAEAGRVNGITDEMLAGQPSLETVFPDFLALIKGTVLAAHNAPFDRGFVDAKLAALHRAGGNDLFGARVWTPPFPALPNRTADTLVLSRRSFPGRARYALQEIAADLGIRAVNAHRAEDDACLCMELFIRCCQAL
jgi:DNA polymerase-3 subunit epsilon